MMIGEVIVIITLTLVVALTIFSSLGLLAMRTPNERLHFITPPAALGSFLLTIAVFVAEQNLQAGLKMALIASLLIFANALVSHATARAIHIRKLGGWETGDSLPAEGSDEEPEPSR